MTTERRHGVYLWIWVVLQVSAIRGATFNVSSNSTDGKLLEGQDLKLNCRVGGKSGFKVAWRGGQDSVPSRTENCISTNTDKYIVLSDCDGSSIFNIVIMNVSHSEDRGNWRCVNGGDESTPLNIRVLVPSRKPLITGYNGSEIAPGRNENLTCESSCSYPNITLRWMSTTETVDQQNIREEISYCRDELYKTTSVLFVPGKKTSSGKTYFTCTASSSEPSIPSLNETVLVNFEKRNSNPTKPPDSGQPAFPWWAGLLIGISCVAVIGLIIFFVMRFKKRS